MGYLANGQFIQIGGPHKKISQEISDELPLVFEYRYGWKFKACRFNNLSTQEQDNLMIEAGKRVQDRRKGRLVE